MSAASKKLLCLSLLLGLSLACSADEESAKAATPATGCRLQAGSHDHEHLHDELVRLSDLVDPTGKLTKMIADFHPHSHSHANATKEADKMLASASEPDQVKRSALVEEGSKKAAEAAEPSATTVAASSSPAPPQAPQASSTSAPEVAPSSSPAAAPAAAPAAPSTTPAPSASTEGASNVTVNIVLEVAPDAKTDEIINNPDKVLSSTTTTPAPEASSTAPSTTTTASITTTTTTVAPTTSAAPASSTSSSTPSNSSSAPATSTGSRRRRRRSAEHGHHSAPVGSTSAPAAASSPAPTSKAPSTTAAPPSTTTTTTGAPSTQPATVEVSARDLATDKPASPEKAPAATLTIEVASSSAAAAPAVAAEPTQPASSTTTTSAPSTSAAPQAPSSTSTSGPAPLPQALPAVQHEPAAAAAAAAGRQQLEEQPREIAPRKPTELTPNSTSADGTRVLQLPETTTTLADNNLNVIYDNDTTLALENSLKRLTGGQALETSTSSPDAKPTLSDFVNCDRGEEGERETYGSCLLGPPPPAPKSGNISHLQGRLNFWQPVNNAGVLHLLVRVRYQQQVASSEGLAADKEEPSKHLERSRRESFSAPIEREPPASLTNATSGTQTGEFPRHKIWLLEESCRLSSSPAPERPAGVLLGQVRAAPSSAVSQLQVDLDAELIVANFNLTGTNQIANRHLLLSLPSGLPLACCQVTLTETMPHSELDSLPSVSVVEAAREELLPDKLRAEQPRKVSLNESR